MDLYKKVSIEMSYNIFSDPCASVGVPAIRPLETLHNGLSLTELDEFLERMTSSGPLNSPAPYPFPYQF